MLQATRSAALVICLLLWADADGAPPNVVLIISDDQAWTDFGFMGHEVIRTPNLDRLARQSVVFERGYVPTSICRPSLASMITGLYPHQHRIVGNDPSLPTGKKGKAYYRNPVYRQRNAALIGNIGRVKTLPRLLARVGYVSHQSGKWWEGHFSRGGFAEGMTHGDPDRGGRHGDAGLTIGREGMGEVLEFIDRAHDAKKPFFVWYAPFLPHSPHNPPERLLPRYRAAGRPTELAKYYAMCEWFDESCGELLDHLDKRKLNDNTLVVFVIDNGWIQRTPAVKVPPGWNVGFAPGSKQSPMDSGLRTPIMLKWPGKLTPRRDRTLVSSIDLAPTILAASGLDVPPEMPGIDLRKLAAGRKPKRAAIFGELFAHDIADVEDPARSLLYRWCIEGRWKLIEPEDGVIGRYRAVHAGRSRSPQLYDVVADPFERHDLVEKNPEVVARLQKRVNDWWKPASKR